MLTKQLIESHYVGCCFKFHGGCEVNKDNLILVCSPSSINQLNMVLPTIHLELMLSILKLYHGLQYLPTAGHKLISTFEIVKLYTLIRVPFDPICCMVVKTSNLLLVC